MIPVFQYHLAFSLKKYSFFSIGKDHQYTEEMDEETVINSLKKLEQSLKENPRIALVLSGIFIEALQVKRPDLLNTIKESLKKDRIILLGTTYHFSLASLYSPGLFKEQIRMHQTLVKKVFDYTTGCFYNTATLFFDKLSIPYKELGITTVIAPISDWHLNGRTSDTGFKGKDAINLILLTDNNADVTNNMIGSFDESVLKSLLTNQPTENYRVPQPIYSKRLVPGKTLSSNALQNAIHQKINYLRKKLKKQQRTELYAALSVFTSIDFFEMLTKTDDQNNRTPHDKYSNLMNALTDFELVNKI